MPKRNKYLSSSSENAEQIKILLAEMERTELTEGTMRAILASCAEQLLRARFVNEERCHYQWLLEELGMCNSDCECAEEYIKYNAEFAYVYKEDLLGFLYLSLRAIKERKRSGSYYTPKDITGRLMEGLLADVRKEQIVAGKTEECGLSCLAILDPACGTGSILLELPDECRLQQIYGYDIDPIAIAIVRINMALKYQICEKKLLTEHFQVRDFLQEGSLQTVDVILGNPPWGSTFTKEEKARLKELFQAAGQKSVESGDLFVEQSLKALQPGGRLCFVLPEAVLHVKTHHKVRSIILEQSTIKRVEYLGEVFDKVQCPSVILLVQKKLQGGCAQTDKDRQNQPAGLEKACNSIEVITEKRQFTISEEFMLWEDRGKSDQGNSGITRFATGGFLLDATDEEFALLRKLSMMENAICLKGQAEFALGIVTGNNVKHLLQQREAGSEPILRGSDIERFWIKGASSYIHFAPGVYQQIAPVALYRAPEKLLYRFVGEKPVFAYDDRQTLTLNSCNIVIPAVEGMDMRYIMAVFNSSVIEFWHRRVNHSMKLLRAHIEGFPIPVVSREQQREIIRMVERMVAGEPIRSELDAKVAGLFRLTDAEYALVRMACEG